MSEQKLKILVGSPTYEGKEYCRKQFVENVRRLSYPHTFVMVDNTKNTSYAAKLRRDGVPVVRVPRGRNSRDALANASNYLRRRVIEGGYDYLFMLESDIFPDRDVIERLLQHVDTLSFDVTKGKRVVGVPYHIEDGKTRHLCVFVLKYNEEVGLYGTRPLTPNEEGPFMDGSLKQIHGMGVGCVLIHRSILEQFPFWYSELDDERMAGMPIRKHPDTYFYLDLHNARVPVYVDTSQYAHHTPSSWHLVKDI